MVLRFFIAAPHRGSFFRLHCWLLSRDFFNREVLEEESCWGVLCIWLRNFLAIYCRRGLDRRETFWRQAAILSAVASAKADCKGV